MSRRRRNEATVSAIVGAHDRPITYVARRYANNGAELDDLRQVGRMALVAALETWDSGRAALWTYARPYVTGAISRFAAKQRKERQQGEDADALPSSMRFDPEQTYSSRESATALRCALDTLTDEERQLIGLRFDDEDRPCSFRKIEAATGVCHVRRPIDTLQRRSRRFGAGWRAPLSTVSGRRSAETRRIPRETTSGSPR